VCDLASVATATPQPTSQSVGDFETGVKTTIVSAYAAMKASIEGFRTLPTDAKKVFIYTGNGLNVHSMPLLFDLGTTKAAAAHMVRDLSGAYANEGMKFYYADERKADGGFANMDISGENHGAFYLKLVEGKEKFPWNVTFVGTEYVDFKELKA
jgi:hypothetical protein